MTVRIIPSIGLVVSTIQSFKPKGKPSVCVGIWREAQQGDLDLSLNRYSPLVEGRDQVLLDVLRSLAEERRQARVTHAYRVVKRFGLPIRTRAEVDAVISFREFLDLCEVYNPNADST